MDADDIDQADFGDDIMMTIENYSNQNCVLQHQIHEAWRNIYDFFLYDENI